MITRDYSHPCIVMWSTGNEVEERDGTADGFAWAKRLADKVRSLDASRPVSATACALFSEYGNRPAGGTTGNQALNMAYDTFSEGRDIWGPAPRPTLPRWTWQAITIRWRATPTMPKSTPTA